MAMHTLPKDWAYAPALDAELKRYLLLGYLQKVECSFTARKLYPHLSELEAHIVELRALQLQLERMQLALVGDIIGFHADTGHAVREPLPSDPWIGVVEEVISASLPQLHSVLADGRALRDEIAKGIRFGPVGLLPLEPKAGWLLLRAGRDASAYAFELALVRSPYGDDPLTILRTRYVTSYSMSIANTFERIKGELIARRPQLPNPAVYAFETDLSLPRIETYIPVAKQLLYEVIRNAA
ncbi:MAG: hypothetical protein IPF41_09665 [Flavobacteriales bacterium]|nr:hypothetical protein [Flavobacteriales bacterium]